MQSKWCNIWRKEKLNWLLFSVLSLLIVVKIALFHYSVFQSILISSLWNSPNDFFAFWLKKIAVAMFFASVVFVVRNKLWTLLMLFIMDIWIFANYIYFRANDLLLTADLMLIVDNMQGFWSSIIAYIDKWIYITVLLTILWCVLLCNIKRREIDRSLVSYGVAIASTVIMWIFGGIAYHNKEYRLVQGEIGMSKSMDRELWKHSLIPLVDVKSVSMRFVLEERGFDNNTYMRFLREHDVFSYLPDIWMVYYCQQKGRYNLLEDANLSLKEEILLSQIYNESEKHNAPTIDMNTNLIVICVESLESWALDMIDVQGREVAPNLRKAAKEAALYADKVSSQARYGNSSDGQMTMITGLLPISYGAASMYYGGNEFPSWAHLYANDVVINPSPSAWNIDVTTVQYGFRKLVQPEKGTMWNDEQVMLAAREIVDTLTEPFAIFAITETMHVPFTELPKDKDICLDFPIDMPVHMKNYLSCVHYTDSCIGTFLDHLRKFESRYNTIVAITGDHTVFKPGGLLKELLPYARNHKMDIADGISYCPLIVLDTTKKRMIYSDVCYQMDIYPTIMFANGGGLVHGEDSVSICLTKHKNVAYPKMMPLNYQINLYESIILQDSMTKLKHILRLFVPPIYYEAKHALFPQKKEERFPLLQIEHTCNRMIIIGNGPSLNKTVELYEQQLHEADCVMVNFSASTSLFERIRPKYYLLADPGLMYADEDRDSIDALVQAIKKKTNWRMHIIMPDSLQKWEGCDVFRENPNIDILFYNNGWYDIRKEEEFEAWDTNRIGPPAQTVLNAAVWLSVYWNYAETYLVGADASFLEDIHVDQDTNRVYTEDKHFYQNEDVYMDEKLWKGNIRYISTKYHEEIETLYIMLKSYWDLRGYAEWKGVNVYNASEYSYIDAFERKKLK